MTHKPNKFAPKKFSPTDDMEDEGNLIIQNLVRKNKRVKLRLGGNDKTPNRDGFVELRESEQVIGKLELQVKPVDRERKRETGRLCYQLPGTLVGHSLVAGLPLILICYDRDTDKAYWKHITKALFDNAKSDQQSKTIDFAPQEEIADGCPYTDAWLALVRKHLEAIRLADSLRSAIGALASDQSFAVLLDSPQDLAELLKQIQDSATQKYKARLEEAQKLFNRAEIEAATKILSPLAAEISDDKQAGLLFDVYIWLGNCYYRLENYDLAEHCFQEALELDKNSPRAQANLSHIFYVKNTHKAEALRLAQSAYKQRPEHDYTVAAYLLCLSFNKKTQEIEDIRQKQKALIDKSSVLLLALGQVAKENHDYGVACKFFMRSIQLDATNHHARILFAESVYKLLRAWASKLLEEGEVADPEVFKNDLDEATWQLTTAINYFTGTTDRRALYRAYDCRALINMARGDFDAALSDCEKMDAVKPDGEFSKIVRAQIYTQINRFGDAIKILEPLANSNRRDILQTLAYSHYRLNHWDEGASCFTRYIDEKTDSDSEVLAFVQCLWFSNQKKRAYQVALMLRKAGRAPVAVMREVELHRLLELQDWGEALEVIEELIRLDPGDGEHWLQRIAMHTNLGNREQAMHFYRELPKGPFEADEWAKQSRLEMEHRLRLNGWLK